MSRRRILLLLPAAFAAGLACRQEKPVRATPGSPKTYTVRGEVVALDPTNRVATLKHQRIEGWMEAMTMEFPVKDPAEFARLGVGDHMEATLYVTDLEYYLGKIQITAKAGTK